jgi:hypothetical protein
MKGQATWTVSRVGATTVDVGLLGHLHTIPNEDYHVELPGFGEHGGSLRSSGTPDPEYALLFRNQIWRFKNGKIQNVDGYA